MNLQNEYLTELQKDDNYTVKNDWMFWTWLNWKSRSFFTFTFMHLADAFIQSDLQVHSGDTFLISMCVPWESNPQPCALLTQCSTTEPQEQLLCSSSGLMIALSQVPLNCWAVFYPRRATDQAEELVTTFTRVAGPMGMRIERPIRVELRDDRTETFVKSIHSQLTSEVGEWMKELWHVYCYYKEHVTVYGPWLLCLRSALSKCHSIFSLGFSPVCSWSCALWPETETTCTAPSKSSAASRVLYHHRFHRNTIPLHFLVQFLFV